MRGTECNGVTLCSSFVHYWDTVLDLEIFGDFRTFVKRMAEVSNFLLPF